MTRCRTTIGGNIPTGIRRRWSGIRSHSVRSMPTRCGHFESGRPVLLIPYIFKQPKPIKRVLIAWNGSKEVARATFDAMPFLKGADSVEIFSVEPVDTGSHALHATVAAITAALARHGIKATHKTQESADKAASVIENRLSDSSIDLLVMGAYTHSRLWQMIFGGTTRTLLHSMTALTLLAR